MRINGHAHIFNLQTVLTSEAVSVIVRRLRNNDYAKFVADGVEDFLNSQLERPQHLTEDGLLRALLLAIAKKAGFKEFIEKESSGIAWPVELRIIGGRSESLGVEGLRSALDRLSTALDRKGGKVGQTVRDLFETLRLAMQPDVVSVADVLLKEAGEDSALVALMMDIVAANETSRDRNNFLAQLRGTANAALARPGRIFPFYAVNPRRKDHFELMKRAIESQGFVGVKLYPSLGYEVTTPEIEAVVRYCADSGTPIVIHASAGGFYKDEASAQFSHPTHWQQLITSHPSLRICFAHCGGWGGFCKLDSSQEPWWDSIRTLMRISENVYGDLAYHVDQQKNAADETTYFKALLDLLADPLIQNRIIFGTDSWLVRLSMSESAYWSYFQDKLSSADFSRISETNPSRFLGLGATLAPNLARHIRWLEARADQVGREPVHWVKAASTVAFRPTGESPAWSRLNRAHVLFYQFVRFEVAQLPKALVGRGFAEAPALRLNQLKYFVKGHEHLSLFANRCRENARNLEAFFRRNGAGHEGARTTGDIVVELESIFSDGKATFAEMGAILDAMFLFSGELT